jgi:hypothetical protein
VLPQLKLQGTVEERLVVAIIGFVGGGLASMIILGLIVSTFGLNYETIWPGVAIGAVLSALLTFFFPRLAEILADFIGL